MLKVSSKAPEISNKMSSVALGKDQKYTIGQIQKAQSFLSAAWAISGLPGIVAYLSGDR